MKNANSPRIPSPEGIILVVLGSAVMGFGLLALLGGTRESPSGAAASGLLEAAEAATVQNACTGFLLVGGFLFLGGMLSIVGGRIMAEVRR